MTTQLLELKRVPLLKRQRTRDRVEISRQQINPKPNSENSYTWSFNCNYALEVAAYVIQTHLRKISSDWLELKCSQRCEFEYDHNKHAVVLVEGEAAFTHEGKIFHYQISLKIGSQTLTSNHKVGHLVQTLKHEIKHNNPLRRKHLQLLEQRSGFRAIMKPAPSIAFDRLVLDPRMIEDIHDNTIFHLKHLTGSNGVIFHGAPGTGKSLMCQAIVHEALAEGFSSCFIIGELNFSILAEFLDQFMTPCIVILEDIDAFGRDRQDGNNVVLSDFLQFLSGLTEQSNKWVVVATTNHLDLLDKAINNRPVRFNRKYEFKLATDREIDLLIDLYFPDTLIPSELKRRCHQQRFTGAHISEIKRTALTLAKKHNKSLAEVFADAVAVVERSFSPALKAVGFAVSTNES